MDSKALETVLCHVLRRQCVHDKSTTRTHACLHVYPTCGGHFMLFSITCVIQKGHSEFFGRNKEI